jgi:hypothetical protein
MKKMHLKGISAPRRAQTGVDECFLKWEPIVGPIKADEKCSV